MRTALYLSWNWYLCRMRVFDDIGTTIQESTSTIFFSFARVEYAWLQQSATVYSNARFLGLAHLRDDIGTDDVPALESGSEVCQGGAYTFVYDDAEYVRNGYSAVNTCDREERGNKTEMDSVSSRGQLCREGAVPFQTRHRRVWRSPHSLALEDLVGNLL